MNGGFRIRRAPSKRLKDMPSEFARPAGLAVLERIRGLFADREVFRRNDVPFVFVCGGPTNTESLRKRFLEWSSAALPRVVMVLAEHAFEDTLFHTPPQTYNLSVFESLIADISDCVIVFPESPGAYAEMGFFSATKIRSKVLVVNDLRYQAKESFVRLGPIDTFDSKSFLRSTLHVRTDDPAGVDFSPIGERLGRLMKRRNRRRLKHSTGDSLSRLEKFLIVLEMIHLIQVASLVELQHCLSVAIGKFRTAELKQLLSILVGSKCVNRVDDEFYVLGKEVSSGLEFSGVDVRDVKASVLLYYKKHAPHYYERVVRKSA
jgi:hypothetical protein